MSNPTESLFRALLKRLEYLERIVSRQTMMINNLIRDANVLDVDLTKGVAIVDAHGIEVEAPWLQQAGDIVDWDPPSKGQRMMLFSPNGDPGRGFLMPGGYTEKKPQPYHEGEMFARTIGRTKITGSGSGYQVETGTFTIKGNVVIEGNISSQGTVTNNGKNIGSTHTNAGLPVD